MTALLDEARLDRINREAAQINIGRAVLTAIAAVFVAIGWTARKIVRSLAWCYTACKVGWQLAAETNDERNRR